jgi:hypothetical protein
MDHFVYGFLQRLVDVWNCSAQQPNDLEITIDPFKSLGTKQYMENGGFRYKFLANSWIAQADQFRERVQD